MAGKDSHFYQPSAGHGLAHDPMTAIIAPRPIGWISTHDGQGRHNLAPYSFFNIFTYRPPIIGFSSIGWKDTVRNIAETREFVWNLASHPLADQMNITSATSPPHTDEFAESGLTPAASRLVGAPRVLESPVNFECRLTQLVPLQNLEGKELATWLVLGEVVAVHIDRAMIKDGVYDTTAGQPILRGGGLADYFAVTQAQLFRMPRP